MSAEMIIFLAISSIFCLIAFFITPLIIRLLKTTKWSEVDCKIMEVKEVDDSLYGSGRGEEYLSFKVLYTYKVEGVDYKCDAYKFDSKLARVAERDVNKFLRKYEKNPEQVCYVNPEDNYDAALEKPDILLNLAIVLPIIFIFFVLLIISAYYTFFS